MCDVGEVCWGKARGMVETSRSWERFGAERGGDGKGWWEIVEDEHALASEGMLYVDGVVEGGSDILMSWEVCCCCNHTDRVL